MFAEVRGPTLRTRRPLPSLVEEYGSRFLRREQSVS